MQKTENYNLNQWEYHDEIKVEDFNADNAAVDGALRALNTAVENLSEERIYIGSYVGDGTESRTIQLPWEPKFAVLMGHNSSTEQLNVLIQEKTFYDTGSKWFTDNGYAVRLSGNTLVVQDARYSNVDSKTVHYILFR